MVVGHPEDVRNHLGRSRLVALSLRRGAEVDVHLAVQVELHVRGLAVAGERQLRVDDPGLPEVVGPRIERRADSDPDPLARTASQLPLARPPRVGVDQLERDVERARQVA